VIADPMALLMAPGDVSEDEGMRKVAADIVADRDSERVTGCWVGSNNEVLRGEHQEARPPKNRTP